MSYIQPGGYGSKVCQCQLACSPVPGPSRNSNICPMYLGFGRPELVSWKRTCRSRAYSSSVAAGVGGYFCRTTSKGVAETVKASTRTLWEDHHCGGFFASHLYRSSLG